MARRAPKPQALSGAARERTILEAARRRFTRFGARKTTMDEVAREAGCSRATLYSHFASKEDLYASLLRADWEAFIEEVEEIRASAEDARRKIRRIVEATRATYAHNQVLRLAAVRDDEMTLGPVAHSFTRDQERKTVDLLRRVLEQGVKEGSLRRIDPERVAYLMFHLGRVLVVRETSGVADYAFDDIMTVMDDVFARGIRKPRGQRG
jgi:TetR/AcrR family transcriptional repressor of mexJK operon